jgi:DNA polymerase eta
VVKTLSLSLSLPLISAEISEIEMPVARPEASDARVIAHVDMDCFYVQVEQRKQPELRGLPSAVVQYNEWQGGGLIAVSYEARKCGVKRSMRGDEAKAACPQIQLVQVPVARGKADLNLYRSAGSEVDGSGSYYYTVCVCLNNDIC